jgi:hypothetical protein
VRNDLVLESGEQGGGYEHEYKSNERAEVKSGTDRKTHTGGSPKTCRCGETLDLLTSGHDYRACTEKAYAADHLRSEARKIDRISCAQKVLTYEHGKGCAEADYHMSSEACRATLSTPFETDDAAANGSEDQAHENGQSVIAAEHFEKFFHFFSLYAENYRHKL